MLAQDSIRGKKVLITGGSGFLGSHLLPLLAHAGAIVTALVRSDQAQATLPTTIQVVKGDLADTAAIAAASRGQDIIIHLAALLFGANCQAYLKANGDYARNIAHAAQAEKSIRRVIFVSSLAAAAPSALPPGIKEGKNPEPVSAYGWSKLLAEQILAASLGGRLVIIRPPIIYGSGDRGLLPLFKSCNHGIGLSPGLRRFPVSIIHADDAAAGILLTCAPEAFGIYHLSDGQVYNMDMICQAIATALGRDKIRVLHPPLPIMGLSATITSSFYRLFAALSKIGGWNAPRAPAWNWDKYLEARQPGWLADNSRIVKELGFKPTHNLESGLAEAVAGYRAAGWL